MQQEHRCLIRADEVADVPEPTPLRRSAIICGIRSRRTWCTSTTQRSTVASV